MWPITQWGTGVMDHMGNGAHEAIVYRGYGVQGYIPWGLWVMGAHGVWGTRSMGNGYRGMGPMGNGAQGAWGTRGMDHMGNGSHGQWGTGSMGHMGNEAHWGYWVQGYGAHGQ